MDLKNHDVEDADHALDCRHVLGPVEIEYTMPCKFVKETESGNWKIVVFGNRYWGDYKKKRVRYVEPSRVSSVEDPIEETGVYSRGHRY